MPLRRQRDIFKIEPIDTQKSTAVGISYPFDNRIFNSTYTTREQLKSNLINYLLTNKGEKLFDPNFGADLKYQLFEPMNDTSQFRITSALTEELEFYIPQIKISAFNYNPVFDKNRVEINIEFIYLLDNATDTVNIQVNG